MLGVIDSDKNIHTINNIDIQWNLWHVRHPHQPNGLRFDRNDPRNRKATNLSLVQSVKDTSLSAKNLKKSSSFINSSPRFFNPVFSQGGEDSSYPLSYRFIGVAPPPSYQTLYRAEKYKITHSKRNRWELIHWFGRNGRSCSLIQLVGEGGAPFPLG